MMRCMSLIGIHRAAKFGEFVDKDHSKLLTFYWLPKLHKRPESRYTVILVHVLLLNCLYFLLLVSLLLKTMLLDI